MNTFNTEKYWMPDFPHHGTESDQHIWHFQAVKNENLFVDDLSQYLMGYEPRVAQSKKLGQLIELCLSNTSTYDATVELAIEFLPLLY